MCEFTIASAIGLIALFNLPGYTECSVGHPYYGYNDDKQEIVCWGYLRASLVEVTDLKHSYSLTGMPEAPPQHLCESSLSLPPEDSDERSNPLEILLNAISTFGELNANGRTSCAGQFMAYWPAT